MKIKILILALIAANNLLSMDSDTVKTHGQSLIGTIASQVVVKNASFDIKNNFKLNEIAIAHIKDLPIHNWPEKVKESGYVYIMIDYLSAKCPGFYSVTHKFDSPVHAMGGAEQFGKLQINS